MPPPPPPGQSPPSDKTFRSQNPPGRTPQNKTLGTNLLPSITYPPPPHKPKSSPHYPVNFIQQNPPRTNYPVKKTPEKPPDNPPRTMKRQTPATTKPYPFNTIPTTTNETEIPTTCDILKPYVQTNVHKLLEKKKEEKV